MQPITTHRAARGRALGVAAPPLGLVLGAVLQLQQPELFCFGLYAVLLFGALLLLAALAATRRAVQGHGWLLLVVCLALGFSAAGLRASRYAQSALDPALDGADLQLIGVVAAMPQRGELGQRFLFEIESAQRDGAPVAVPPRVLLNWYRADAQRNAAAPPQSDAVALRAGDRWRLTARLKNPHGSVNPHGFDVELWFWEQGVQATGYLRGAADAADAPHRVEATGWHPIERARQSVRDAIFERVADRQAAGILAALVTGDQAAIERTDWDVFRATGVAHLMSISGLHITMFAWLAAVAVGWLWRRSARLCLLLPAPKAALAGGLLLAGSYALFSGWGVPAQRTVLMLACVSLLRWSGRRWPWPQLWLFTCAVVTSADPWALTQAGFWLSFVAVGVLFATDSGAEGIEGMSADSGFLAKIRSKSWSLVREQARITIALAPLTLLLFNQLSLVGLPANLLAIPWITLLVTPLALAGMLVPALWSLAALCVQALGAVLATLAAWPFATVALPSADALTSAAGLAGGLLLVLRLPWRLRLLGLPLLLSWLLWQLPRPAAGEFELLAADIGQGNAVLVRTARHTLLYDAGPRYSSESDAGSRVLAPLLAATGEQLDLLVLSHSDSDHTGGAAALLRARPAAALLGSLGPDHPLQALRALRRCEAGQRWEWDGVQFAVLHPAAADYVEGAKPNTLSCVLRITNGRRSALLVGDIEARQEARLVQGGGADLLGSDLLLVPHHGSKTSSSAAFLDAVHPRIALVQAGWRNRFGHPAAPVVVRYRERGIALIDSPHCGAMRWRTLDPDAVACERETDPRYWRHRVDAAAAAAVVR